MRVHAIVKDLQTAQRAVDVGATVVQLRVKAPTDEVVAAGYGFRDLAATFIVNDDVDAALALQADGVHLGRGDGGAGAARAAGLLVGRSASTLAEALDEADADYLGVGPVWATPSKFDAAAPLGLNGLREVCAAVTTPVVAIGGVDAWNAPACIHAGAAGVAVIRAAIDPRLRQAVDDALADR
ncbi:MAG TPA: thiamine phosphate synthase [Gaiellaceae bacterium]|jgi:thiamine-phosphate diphosphorylase